MKRGFRVEVTDLRAMGFRVEAFVFIEGIRVG